MCWIPLRVSSAFIYGAIVLHAVPASPSSVTLAFSAEGVCTKVQHNVLS